MAMFAQKKLSQSCQEDETFPRRLNLRHPRSSQTKPPSTSGNPPRPRRRSRSRVQIKQKSKKFDGEVVRNRRRSSLSPKKVELLQLKGFEEKVDDHVIVWPPMVVVKNTRSYQDNNGNWVGAKRHELLCCFKDYDIKNVKNVYGPAGHSGVSLLIFDDSAAGYFEAECLHRQFLVQGRGKDGWRTHQGRALPSTERLLYGYMVTVGDMLLLNRRSDGKQRHKYEMKPYKMMVVDPCKNLDARVRVLETRVESDSKEKEGLHQKLHLQEIEITTMKQKAFQQIEESNEAIEYLNKHYVDIIKELSDDLEKTKTERGWISKLTKLPLFS